MSEASIELTITKKVKITPAQMQICLNASDPLVHIMAEEEKGLCNILELPKKLGYQHGYGIQISIDIATGKIIGWDEVLKELPEYLQAHADNY
jgi:hypothetical protein